MNDPNPYAAPQSLEQPMDAVLGPLEPGATGWLWQKGRLMVMHRDAVLPSVCVKSNQPADGRLVRKLHWHHPALILVFLLSPLIYIILALLLTKRARIEIGLSEQWFARRWRAMVIGWSLVLAGVAAIAAGLLTLDRSPETGGWLMLAGVVVLFVGAIFGLLRARLVSPDRISADYVWLKGVHPDFLRQLPHWPYNP